MVYHCGICCLTTKVHCTLNTHCFLTVICDVQHFSLNDSTTKDWWTVPSNTSRKSFVMINSLMKQMPPPQRTAPLMLQGMLFLDPTPQDFQESLCLWCFPVLPPDHIISRSVSIYSVYPVLKSPVTSKSLSPQRTINFWSNTFQVYGIVLNHLLWTLERLDSKGIISSWVYFQHLFKSADSIFISGWNEAVTQTPPSVADHIRLNSGFSRFKCCNGFFVTLHEWR